MTTPRALARLRELHEKAKRGALDPAERAAYGGMRAQVAQGVVSAQKMPVPAGETPAMAMRVPQAVKVTVSPPSGGRHSSITVDLAADGFSTLLPMAPSLGASCAFELRIGAESVAGTGKVLSVNSQGSVHRVWISLSGLAPAQRERLEMFVLDAFLKTLPP